jgi:hypothetical protein
VAGSAATAAGSVVVAEAVAGSAKSSSPSNQIEKWTSRWCTSQLEIPE